jgi:hypothetical protein
MNALIPTIWAAGGLLLFLAAANFFLPRKLDYAGNLPKLTPILRQIFVVHSVFIVILLLGFSAACFLFAPDLAGGSALGRLVSGFIGVFWLLRAAIQRFYYDPELRRQHRAADIGFTWLFLFFGGLFTFAAVAGPRLAETTPALVAYNQWERLFDIALWLAGAGHFIVLIASFQVPSRLGWRQDFAQLKRFNQKLVWTYSGYIVLTILAFGILTLCLHDEFLRGDRSALGLAAFMGVFWSIRVTLDFACFGHDDWPRGFRFVIAHVLLTLLLIALAGTYLGLLVWRLGKG